MKHVLLYDSARAICSSVFISLTTTNVPTELRQASGRKRSIGPHQGAHWADGAQHTAPAQDTPTHASPSGEPCSGCSVYNQKTGKGKPPQLITHRSYLAWRNCMLEKYPQVILLQIYCNSTTPSRCQHSWLGEHTTCMPFLFNYHDFQKFALQHSKHGH